MRIFSEPPFRNEFLFSNHYLTHHLPRHPQWKIPVHREYERLRSLYAELQRLHPSHLNEAQLEDLFIRPVLKEVLGWHVLPQGSVRIQGRHRLPDEALFAEHASLEQFVQHARSPQEAYAHAVAILEAKPWEQDLDVGRGDNSPHFQLVGYLSWLPVRYGMLTNGRIWRLYIKGENVGPRTFYEVDLEQVLASEDNLRYFLLFFRKDAFLAHAHEKAFVEMVRTESLAYARGLEENLRKVIYGRWLELVGRSLYAATSAPPDQVFEATLLLLFRLLFIGYAEARQILPAREGHPYDPYSLNALMGEILQPSFTPSTRGTQLFERVKVLFDIVNKGDANLGVPAYNGGLFADTPREEDVFAEERVLLRTVQLPDTVTTEMLKLLFVREEEHGLQRVDFSTLDTRRLGSIYEGLTEYTFRVAEEPMLVVQGPDGAEFVIAASLSPEHAKVVRRIDPGELYLVRHDGARKATGTYYTPDVFVSYLVRQAVDAVLEPLVRKMEERQQVFESLKEHAHLDERGKAQNIESLEYATADELLQIRIVDPAMGSGHFLVEAVRYLTERLITLAERYPHTGLRHHIEELRQEIAPHAQNPEVLDDASLLRRLVVKRCIFGVDLNPLAVELAKLSLWLETAVSGAPLSFLSHHLRTGNALIGYDLDELLNALDAPKKNVLWMNRLREKLKEVARHLERIQTLKDSTVDEVYRSTREFFAVQQEAAPLRFLLDLATAAEYPGYDELAKYHPVKAPDDRMIEMVVVEGLDRVREVYPHVVAAVERFRNDVRPFHWWLEFPEAWKAGGFDVVIGNPPWDKVKFEDPMFFTRFDPAYRRYKKEKKSWVRERVLKFPAYREEYEHLQRQADAWTGYIRAKYHYYADRGDINLYRVFMERSLQLLREGGVFAYVVPGAFYQEDGSAGLRRYLLEENRLEAVLGFENRREEGGRFFPDVDERIKIALVIARKGGRTERPVQTFFLKRSPDVLEDPEAVLAYDPGLLRRLSPDKLAFLELHSPMDVQIVRKCYDQYPPLGSEEHAWKIDFTNDLHMTNDRDLFHEDGGDLPLYEGKMIWQYRHDWAPPRYWLKIEELKQQLRRDGTPKFQLPDGSWRWEHYRVAFREVASNTNVRTLIATVVPRTLAGHTLWIEKMDRQLSSGAKFFAIGWFNSITADYFIRLRAVMHIQKGMLESLPFPSLVESDVRLRQVALKTARLIGYTQVFSEIMASIGLDWEKDGVPPLCPEHMEEARRSGAGMDRWLWVEDCSACRALQEERIRLQAEIDVIVARDIFHLTREEFEHVLRSVRAGKDKDSPLKRYMDRVKDQAREMW